MHDTIWAPWRMAYIENSDKKEEGCVFCNRLQMPETRWKENYILEIDNGVMVLMNKYPYTNGHIMVVPAKHVSLPFDLEKKEYLHLTEVLNRSVKVMKEVFAPEGLNVGMNLGRAAGAGIADHIHFHIVPRWIGDNNFMPVIGSVRVMPEYLADTYEKMKPAFKGICNL